MIVSKEIEIGAGGVRLDAAVLSAFPSSTRALVREAIASGDILLNFRRALKGARLAPGARIQIRALPEADDLHILPDPAVSVNEVYADADLLAFDKPPCQSVHPLSRTETHTLMNGVAARYPECIPLGDTPFMAGALHRIDSGTSGLVLVARNAATYAAMRDLFAAKAVEKTYLALVEGRVEKGATLEYDLAHDPRLPYCRMIDAHRNRLTTAERERLRPLHAVTAYEPIDFTRVENEERTLLKVTIFTGVTHQIRASLSLAGIHIVNDRLYGAFAVENMQGHCLHALSAAFIHPATSRPVLISTPRPPWHL